MGGLLGTATAHAASSPPRAPSRRPSGATDTSGGATPREEGLEEGFRLQTPLQRGAPGVQRQPTSQLLEQAFLPARLLRGLLPDALLESHLFWQNGDGSLSGYPAHAAPRGGDGAQPSSGASAPASSSSSAAASS